MSGDPTTLFVWRHHFVDDDSDGESSEADRDLLAEVQNAVRREGSLCPVCRMKLELGSTPGRGVGTSMFRATVSHNCLLCGWSFGTTHISFRSGPQPDDYADSQSHHLKTLEAFDINAPEVALDELGSFLQRNMSLVYSLSPRRFEELTADIFREHGYDVRLTPATRDGGADLLLLASNGMVNGIVECKRYAPQRYIGVDLVREVVGAAVDWRVNKAFIVTSSTFSAPARKKILDYRERGHEIGLVDLSELAIMLKVYNADLPRLEALTEEMRSEILRANTRQP